MSCLLKWTTSRFAEGQVSSCPVCRSTFLNEEDSKERARQIDAENQTRMVLGYNFRRMNDMTHSWNEERWIRAAEKHWIAFCKRLVESLGYLHRLERQSDVQDLPTAILSFEVSYALAQNFLSYEKAHNFYHAYCYQNDDFVESMASLENWKTFHREHNLEVPTEYDDLVKHFDKMDASGSLSRGLLRKWRISRALGEQHVHEPRGDADWTDSEVSGAEWEDNESEKDDDTEDHPDTEHEDEEQDNSEMETDSEIEDTPEPNYVVTASGVVCNWTYEEMESSWLEDTDTESIGAEHTAPDSMNTVLGDPHDTDTDPQNEEEEEDDAMESTSEYEDPEGDVDADETASDTTNTEIIADREVRELLDDAGSQGRREDGHEVEVQAEDMEVEDADAEEEDAEEEEGDEEEGEEEEEVSVSDLIEEMKKQRMRFQARVVEVRGAQRGVQ